MSFQIATLREPTAPDEVRVQLQGAFDAASAASSRAMFERLANAPVRRVVLDLSGLGTIDGCGIGAIAFLFKRLMARGMTLVASGASGQPLAMLRELGLASVLGLTPPARSASRGWFGGKLALAGR